MEEIGICYGITRERVRQILKDACVFGGDGGAAVRAKANLAIRKELYAANREQRCQRRFECSYAEYRAINGRSNTMRRMALDYTQQKTNAQSRGIGWNLSLPDWVDAWKSSGKLGQRRLGGYVMTRIDLNQPFSKDNIKIVKHSESSESSIRWMWDNQKISGSNVGRKKVEKVVVT